MEAQTQEPMPGFDPASINLIFSRHINYKTFERMRSLNVRKTVQWSSQIVSIQGDSYYNPLDGHEVGPIPLLKPGLLVWTTETYEIHNKVLTDDSHLGSQTCTNKYTDC
jgi:hypothetical protein